jgi:cysteine desulfurase
LREINSVSKKLAISSGSACTTQMVEPSHVLLALGLSEEQTHSAIRMGCSRFNTEDEIHVTIDEISHCVESLAKIHT